MENDLHICHAEYLSNQWLDLSQILNLILGYPTELKNCLKLRQPPMEDNIKMEVEYLSNNWLDLSQILNLS